MVIAHQGCTMHSVPAAMDKKKSTLINRECTYHSDRDAAKYSIARIAAQSISPKSTSLSFRPPES